jgi:pyridinium-3,5-biscarboxylic acid mononucleotide sulfurtransferase
MFQSPCLVKTTFSVRCWLVQVQSTPVKYSSMVVTVPAVTSRCRWIHHRRVAFSCSSCCCRRTITTSKDVHEDKNKAPSSLERTTTALVDVNSWLLPSAIQQGNHTTNMKQDLTKVVDDLLHYTESLFTRKLASDAANDDVDVDATSPFVSSSSYTKDDSTSTLSHPSRHHIIAFSGGIDSSVVTALIHQVHQNHFYYQQQQKQQQQQQKTTIITKSTIHHKVTAVLGLSPAVSHQQRVLAEQVAGYIGVDFETVSTTEGDDDVYQANDGRACLACKTHLYTCLSSIAQHYMNGVPKDKSQNHDQKDQSQKRQEQQLQQETQLYNGTNADDLRDTTRLGLIAAHNFDVQSPLQYTPKVAVRMVGKHLGLPNWDYASSPCLRSRLAYGVAAIPDHLQSIERAEDFVRQAMSSLLKPSHNLRVRLLSGHRAMIEVDDEWVDYVRECLQQENATATTTTTTSSSSTWRSMLVDTLGFRDVNVRPFKTGSVAITADTTIISSRGT